MHQVENLAPLKVQAGNVFTRGIVSRKQVRFQLWGYGCNECIHAIMEERVEKCNLSVLVVFGIWPHINNKPGGPSKCSAFAPCRAASAVISAIAISRTIWDHGIVKICCDDWS